MLSETVAHYGSAAAEIAVCSKAVGLVERSDLCLLDVSGAATLLEHALAPAISDAVPAAGEARCVADTWCCRIEPDRAAGGRRRRGRRSLASRGEPSGGSYRGRGYGRGAPRRRGCVDRRAQGSYAHAGEPAARRAHAGQCGRRRGRRRAGLGRLRGRAALPVAVPTGMFGRGTRGNRRIRAPARARPRRARGSLSHARGATHQRLTFGGSGKYGP